MKKIILFFLILIIITSCITTQPITMFQDIQKDIIMKGVPKEPPVYIIKPYDNLYLSILTLDPEVNKLFNASAEGGVGGGTQQLYGAPALQYINGYMVEGDGSIFVPLIGKIQVAELNLIDAQKLVTKRAEEFLKQPNIKVKVLNFKVNIAGEVNKPGLYYNYEGSLNILDAISMANGITQYANLNNVTVVRHMQDNSNTYKLNLTDKSIYYSDAFYLQPNDLVYIEPNKNIRQREKTATYGLFLSTLSTLLLIVTLVIP